MSLDDDPDMINRRSTIIKRLIQACRQSLSERAMEGLFLDGVNEDEQSLMSLGKLYSTSCECMSLSFPRLPAMGRVSRSLEKCMIEA